MNPNFEYSLHHWSGSDDVNSLFQWISKTGKISNNEMFNTFNMGIGMVIATSDPNALSKSLSRVQCASLSSV